MSVSKTLFGNTVVVPERKETGWGAQVTQILDDLIDAAEAVSLQDSSGNTIAKVTVASSTLAASATLTPTATRHRVAGDGAAVTLDTTTAIADGGADGQVLVLEGTHASNTVTIQDAANTDLNGDVTLAQGDVIRLTWNASRSVWVEDTRNN